MATIGKYHYNAKKNSQKKIAGDDETERKIK